MSEKAPGMDGASGPLGASFQSQRIMRFLWWFLLGFLMEEYFMDSFLKTIPIRRVLRSIDSFLGKLLVVLEQGRNCRDDLQTS